MPPRDAGVEWETASRSSTIAPDAIVAPAGTIRTGAQLGWFRSVLGVGAVVVGVRYLIWQASIAPATVLGVLFIVAEASSIVVLSITVLTLLDRGTRTAPRTPSGTLDVFVTVCGEPLEVVERAVRSALAIRYTHKTYVLNDGRIAGIDGWEAIDELAARLGAEPITRTTGGRSKAANLNHALRLTSGEFVATIDADHRADPDLAQRTLRWFSDESVAFVTAAQRFDVEVDVLNNRQPLFHTALQRAKDAAGCAISCGSGVVYRRGALDEINGFSEWNIVEDLHTSYRLHSAGWTSVYERDAVTTGLAPQTAAEYAHQRSRWMLDGLRLFLLDNPLRQRGLSVRGRVHYMHTTGSYLLGIPLLLFLILPPLYLVFRLPAAGGSSTGEYIVHAAPYFAMLIAFFGSLVGVSGALRAFRSAIFDAGMTPIALVRALARPRPGGVTNKSGQRRLTWLLLPQFIAVVLLLASLAFTVVDDRDGASAIAVTWAALLALTLVGPLTAWSERAATVRSVSGSAQIAVGLLGIAAVVGSLTPASDVFRDAPIADPVADSPQQFVVTAPDSLPPTDIQPAVTVATRGVAPEPSAPVAATVVTTTPAPGPSVLAVPTTGAYLGVAHEGIQTTARGVDDWSRAHAGARPAIVHWFQHWGSGENRFRDDWVAQVAAQGAIPMISWEPWAKPPGKYAAPLQTEFRLERIIAGEFDGYVRAWAAAAAAHGEPILLRFMHEFNGDWYPWSLGLHGQTPEMYVEAWRHVHAIFDQEGAANVSWIWSPVSGFQDHRPAYPGDDVVDWVSTTLLNAAVPEAGGWFDYVLLAGSAYAEMEPYGKPIMLSEVSTHQTGGDPAAWWTGLFATVPTEQPLVRAVVIFDMPYDERIEYRLTEPAAQVVAEATSSGWFSLVPEVRPAG